MFYYFSSHHLLDLYNTAFMKSRQKIRTASRQVDKKKSINVFSITCNSLFSCRYAFQLKEAKSCKQACALENKNSKRI